MKTFGDSGGEMSTVAIINLKSICSFCYNPNEALLQKGGDSSRQRIPGQL